MIDQATFQQMMNNQQQFQAFQQQFQAFQQQFQGGGFPSMAQNPQQAVMQRIQSGQMSQEDFDRCRMMANKLTGKNY